MGDTISEIIFIDLFCLLFRDFYSVLHAPCDGSTLPYNPETYFQQRQWFEQYKNNENELIFAIDDMDLNCMVGSISLYDICRERHLASIGRIQIGDFPAKP